MEKKEFEYRIQKRNWSSNVLERRIGKAKWQVFLVPTVNKKEGDAICNLIKFFSELEL